MGYYQVKGGSEAAFLFQGSEVTKVKKFLVMKWVEGLNQVAGMIAMPGLYTLDAAQEFLLQAASSEPEAHYLIQEVGAA